MNFVCGFVKCGREVLLIEKRKSKLKILEGKMNGIGGEIRESEKPLDAMVRECLEESNLLLTAWQERVHLVGPGFNVIFFTAICPFSAKANIRNGPEGPVGWFNLSLLPLNVFHNVPWLLQICFDERQPGPVTIEVP